MFRHLVFGLSVRAPFSIPELERGGTASDVTVRFGRIDRASRRREGECLFASDEEAVFFWKDAGRFLVKAGRDITIDRARGSEIEAVRRYLLGPVLAMLLHQRGFVVLHGSAVAVGDGAIAVIGNSGQGKSTTVAALVDKGHQLLGDDIVAIEMQGPAGPSVVPGFPEINLWSDAAGAIGGVAALPVTRTECKGEKRAYQLNGACRGKPVPLRSVYVLHTDLRPSVGDLKKSDALRALFDHSFGPTLARFGAGASLLQLCADVVRAAAVRRLTRSSSLADLPSFIELIEEDAPSAEDAHRAEDAHSAEDEHRAPVS